MLLWLASYPRSGNWFLRVVLKEVFGVGSRSVYSEAGASSAFDPRAGLESLRLEEMISSDELCLLKTHELPGTDRHPAIYIVRDGRDALVSYAHFAIATGEVPTDTGGDVFRETLGKMVATNGYFGGWAPHVTAWTTRMAPTAVIRFEELIEKPIDVVSGALAKLGIDLRATGKQSPTFAELRTALPTLFRRGKIGAYADEMPKELEDLFWARSGSAMRRLGYAYEKRSIEGPLVTVITPSLNQGRFIRDAIASVRNQDYPHVEHIVVDGGSSDETSAVVAQHADGLTWISEPDRGQSEAINKGIRLAKGAIVCWVNCDDMLLPRAISQAVEVFRERPEVGAVYGDGYILDADGQVRSRFPSAGAMNVWRLVHVSDFILQPATFFRREVFEEVGYVDESLNWGLDWELLIRVAQRYPMASLPMALAAQRDYAATKTASGGHKRFRELVRIMRRHGRYRYPPAYFTYGVDTYRKMIDRVIDRWQPRFGAAVTNRLRSWIAKLTERVIVWGFKGGEGWYADDWVTTRAHFDVHREGAAIVLRGTLPEAYPKLRGQTLEVIVNGRARVRRPLQSGGFEFVVPVDGAERLVNVELRASHSFVPRREGFGDDPRRLAYLLHDFKWTESRTRRTADGDAV